MSNSLSAVHPELVAEWSDRNLPLTPDSITFGSNKKVWWKGACGHEWETSVKARSNGEKCPICSGARVVTGINDLSTLKSELASEWSEKNKIKPTEVSIGSHKKVIWKCKLEHEWIATVKSRSINRTGCPYCSHNKVLAGFNDLATLFPEVADEWSDKNEKKPTEVMAFANSKAWWKCRTCGYEWNTLISTRSGGSKCPCCSGYTFIKGKNDLKSTHPQIAEEWSEKNFPLKPNEVNAKSRKNVWWRCGKCGSEWKSVINAVASREDKEAMFLEYSELLNSLDSGATTKLTINNRRLNRLDFEKTILIPETGDELDEYREEYNKMLLDKATGANSTVQDKYVTISINKKNVDDARTYFARVGADLISHFSRLGSKCVELETDLCQFAVLKFQQMDGLNTVMPYGTKLLDSS